MPQGDRRGPNGNGPKSGRGLGFCTGNETAGNMAAERGGRGAGFGRGGGFGNQHRRGGFGAGRFAQEDFSGVKEKTIIENEINILKDQLAALEERLNNTEE